MTFSGELFISIHYHFIFSGSFHTLISVLPLAVKTVSYRTCIFHMTVWRWCLRLCEYMESLFPWKHHEDHVTWEHWFLIRCYLLCFNVAVIRTGYVATDAGLAVKNEGGRCERKWSRPNLMCSGICLVITRETSERVRGVAHPRNTRMQCYPQGCEG
jgi:hypothetical protein